ncbi:MAG TPA: hypothetical protein VL495_08155 [Edaphobacter sp.]|nr:hypothetical protein [Edaphobacter sp.]
MDEGVHGNTLLMLPKAGSLVLASTNAVHSPTASTISGGQFALVPYAKQAKCPMAGALGQ